MNICIFGDSIAWGANDYEKGGWVERLKSYCLKNKEDVHVYNLGISGDDTDGLFKRFELEAAARDPNLIIFAIGINDSHYIENKDNNKVSLNAFEKNISKLAEIAQKFTDKIIFIGLTRVDETKMMPTPWDAGSYYDNQSIEKYDAIVKEFCEKNGLNYISMKGVTETADLEDGLHPNSKGHEKMFRTVLGAVDNFLK